MFQLEHILDGYFLNSIYMKAFQIGIVFPTHRHPFLQIKHRLGFIFFTL